MRRLPKFDDPNLLVGLDTGDDAGVYRLDRNRALVQTADFFTPIVDDAFAYGRIAAANALSDVYAMGGRPLTALNLLGVPTDRVPSAVIRNILRGGSSTLREAGCVLVGGHTIRNPEPIYGLAVTGLVSPRQMLTNANGQPGDALVLTKPLGLGIITTAIKRGLASRVLARKAIRQMQTLNVVGAEIAERRLARAATDVTGFGLLGQLALLCRGSGVGAEISADQVPAIAPAVFDLIARGCVPGGSRENLSQADKIVKWNDVSAARRILLADAQTSGGLLLCVPPRHLTATMKVLKFHHTPCAAVIGQIVKSSKPKIWVSH